MGKHLIKICLGPKCSTSKIVWVADFGIFPKKWDKFQSRPNVTHVVLLLTWIIIVSCLQPEILLTHQLDHSHPIPQNSAANCTNVQTHKYTKRSNVEILASNWRHCSKLDDHIFSLEYEYFGLHHVHPILKRSETNKWRKHTNSCLQLVIMLTQQIDHSNLQNSTKNGARH